jgi:multidrug efflux pump subunit AcrB
MKCCAKSICSRAVIPADVTVSITRNYGETAAEKSNELLLHMGIAVFSVAILIWLTLGWRESGIVAVAIPATLALTLLVFYLYGFTLNRITLFALIFSIGILVDDAIVVVENIVRHFHLPQNKGRNWSAIAVEAVGEVGNPTILATFAVIAAVLPMAFVGGLMGPYMRPIPIGASAAMFLVAADRVHRHALGFAFAFCVGGRSIRSSPKARRRRSKTLEHHDARASEDFFTKLYRRMMGRCCITPAGAGLFLIGITVLLLASMATVGLGWVKVKMLPFDNKSEFQVILNMPEGSSLEQTAAVAREMAAAIRTEPEVTDYQVYAGVAVALQLQRPRASLLHASRRQRRRHPGEPRRQARAQSAEPRHRQTHPSRRHGHRGSLQGACRHRRGAARPAGAADARRRDLRAE